MNALGGPLDAAAERADRLRAFALVAGIALVTALTLFVGLSFSALAAGAAPPA